MILLGSIFQIPLYIIPVTGMDQPACVSYAASNDAYTIDESLTQPDLPPGIESKYPLCHVTVQHGTQTMVNKMQVLHHVRYFKLYTYV